MSRMDRIKFDEKGRPRCQEWVHTAERWDFRGHQCERIARADQPDPGPGVIVNGPFTKCKQHSDAGRSDARKRQEERSKKSFDRSP